MAGRNLARALAAVLVMLVAVVALPAAGAVAIEPVVTIEEPQDETSTNSLTPLLAGSTNDPFAGTVTVNVYEGAGAVGTAVQSPTVLPLIEGHWEVTADTLSQGVYTAVAEQTDAAAVPPETGKSNEVTFTIDTTKPGVSLHAVPTPSKDASPTLSGEGGEETGDAPEVALTLCSGKAVSAGSELGTIDVPVSGGGWSHSLSSLADGTYTAQATQHDLAGNVGASSPVTFTIDTSPPNVSIAPVTSPTNNPAPAVGGAAGTASGDIATVAVTIKQGGSVVQATDVVVSGGKWSYTPSPKLPDGSYSVVASQEDQAHNVGEAEATFTVDATPPAITASEVATPTNDSTPTLGGLAGTAGGDAATVAVKIKQGVTVVQSASVGVVGGMWSYTSPGKLPDGSYTVVASQEDQAHNVGQAEATFTVDATPPAVTVTPTAPTKDLTPTVGGLAGTAGGDAATVAVKIEQGVTVLQSASVGVVGGKWSYTATELAGGSYTVAVSQEDQAHNVGQAEATFTIDVTAPAVTVTQPTSPTNNPSPVLGGLAGTAGGDAATVAVKIEQGVTVLQSASVGVVGGKWSYTPSPKLAGGSYTAVVSQEDQAHNVGQAEAAFTIDVTAPAVTVTQPTSPTNNPSPVLGGLAGTAGGDAATVAVKIEQGVTVLQSASVGVVGGKWSYTPSPTLADGSYTVVATQEDEAHNLGTSEATFTVDVTPPAVTVTSPTSPTNDSTPTLGGAAGTASGDKPTVAVTIKQGATVLQTASVAVSGATWSYTATKLADGTYSVQASQEDQAHNLTTTPAASFTVDTVAPVVTASEVAALTNDPTPALRGAAGTLGGDAGTVAVKVKQTPSGTVVQTASVAVIGGKWSYSPATALADGSYAVVASQEDEAHNVGEAEASFTIDATPPAVTVTPPASPTHNAQPALGGVAGTASGDLPALTVKIYNGATVGGALRESANVLSSGGKWSYTPPSKLPDGTYTVQAAQEDQAHNLATRAATFTVDTVAPVVSAEVSASTNDSTPTVGGTAGTAPGDSASVAVQIKQGATVLQTVNVAVIAGRWSYTATKLADGSYTVLASQEDEAHNLTTVTASFALDATPPHVTLSSPASPTDDTTPTLSGEVGTASGDLPQVTVGIYNAAAEQIAGATLSTSGATWSYTPSSKLPDGSYTVVATQEDEAHNRGTAEATFTLDTTPPLVTLQAIGAWTNKAKPTLSGTGGGESGDATHVVVNIFQGTTVTGKEVESASAAVNGGAWSYTPANALAAGTYTAQATQSDAAGNVGVSAPTTFTVDVTAPVLSVASPGSGAKEPVADPEITGTTVPASGDEPQITVKIYKGKEPSGTPETVHTLAEGKTWTTGSTPEELENGQYTVQAEQQDEAGNVGKSPPVTFTVETRLSLEPSVFVLRAGTQMTDATPSFDGTAAQGNGHGSVRVRIQSLAPGSSGDAANVLASLIRAHWSADVTESLPDGSYKLLVEQSGEGVIEKEFAVDGDAPLVTLSSPVDGSSTANTSETAAGSAGNAVGDAAQVTANLYAGASAGGGALQSVTVAGGPGGSWATTFGSLSPGTYTVRAEQRDDVGNVGTSQPATFTVVGAASPEAVAAPVPPVASFEWVPVAPHTGEPVTLVSTSSDADSPLTAFAWSLSADNVFKAGPPVLVTSFATPGVHAVQLSVTDALGLSSVVTKKIGVSTPAVKVMQPFPVVRIAGTQHPGSVKVTLLSVLAPVGASVSITCRGHGCPSRSQSVLATVGASKNKSGTVLITLRRFERSLPAGVILEIKVSSHGVIGKFTRFTVRRRKLPSRYDACLNPAGTTPISCPL